MTSAHGKLVATVFVFALTLVTVVFGPVQPVSAGGCSPGFGCPDCIRTYCAKQECPEFCGCMGQCIVCGGGDFEQCYSICSQIEC